LPNHSTLPVDFVQAVLQRFRNQDWSGVFLSLTLMLVPAGLVIFVARDRYYRRRGDDTLKLTL
jgi:hypothetical protein